MSKSNLKKKWRITDMKITLCGSARFEEYFKFWNEMLSLYGHTIYTLSVYPSQKESGKDWYDEQEKKTLDQVHLDKINNSDAIFVINPFAYLGESTLKEIEYAKRSGKEIFCLESWGEGNGISKHMHHKHVVELAKWFGVPDEFGSPVPTVCNLAAHSPQLLGYGASSIRSKIFTCKKLFELSLYDRAGIDFDIKSI